MNHVLKCILSRRGEIQANQSDIKILVFIHIQGPMPSTDVVRRPIVDKLRDATIPFIISRR